MTSWLYNEYILLGIMTDNPADYFTNFECVSCSHDPIR